MSAVEQSIHEVDFCGQVASAANALFKQDPAAFPFAEARVEGFGTGTARRKRKDLRFFEPGSKLALCGEVKLPGTREGRSPYDEELVRDAFLKADDAVVDFFFTWNVNVFVLWDRKQIDKPLLERRVREWKLGMTLASPEDVARPENLDFIKTHFLPDLVRDLADIYTGLRRDWTMPPDDIFIRSLESHLDWPVQLTTGYLIDRTERNKPFDVKVQQWLADQDRFFVRNVADEWHAALANMAKTLAYVWANRLIFYKALRARFTDLPRLALRASVKTPDDAARAFDRYFDKAVQRSGDYEPLLFPNAQDWASGIVFEAPNALDAWRGLLRGIESVNFKDVPSDIVGRIFQKLIGPEERHRYGQHFTGDDVVDLINSFCVHRATDNVLDPACGSGSFLVRAYYRKGFLDPARHHLDYLFELFGCDIALYPAHLATLNLAAREISDEANYPRIVRRDFFATEREKPFCTVPDDAGGRKDVYLPELDAVVGNPPYVRQEKIDRRDKQRYSEKARASWSNGLSLSGRADLHCYFWPVATKLLKPDGYFGFLTSSSWLDVEYGFALQGWILRHFKLLAIMESAAEPWFPDARVKTAVTILQRCEDEPERKANLVRFVRFDKPLRDIIGVPSGTDEAERHRAVERLRDRILSAATDTEDDTLRIIVKPQRELWADGVRAGSILRGAPPDADGAHDDDDDDGEEGTESAAPPANHQNNMAFHEGEYAAGKWGRYVRAPSLYFRFMERFGRRFVALGEIATVRRGITSGCDAFFMPRDISSQLLREVCLETGFRRRSGGASRKDVESGKLRIIQAGDGSVHAIEAEFLAPEVHSLMKVDRPIVRAKDVDRVVLLVGQPMKDLRGTWVHKYLKYGEQATFASKKSKAVPVPQRSTCAARDPWYDLTKLVKPGFAFWPMAQQYRHIIAGNPERLVCNHNLFDLSSEDLSRREQQSLWALLNSTLVGLFKTFYGRFAGTEGNLKTEVVDVNLLEVPNPREVSAGLACRLTAAVKSMNRRPIGRLVEEQLMDCHAPERARRLAAGPLVLSDELRQADRRALDDAVFELLGVVDPGERAQLVGRLHEETARHFRAIRVVEIEKMEQRSRTANRRFSVQELAADAWDAAELPEVAPLAEWLGRQPECTSPVNIPDDRPAYLSPSPMFDPNTVYFGKRRPSHIDCRSSEEARLVTRLANLGVSGWVKLPREDKPCQRVSQDLDARLNAARKRFQELAESRTSDPRLQDEIIEQLVRWFVLGRRPERPAPSAADSEEGGSEEGGSEEGGA
jgi:methylase of polypeptide subunit release factors